MSRSKRRRVLTNKDLREQFLIFNNKFFGGRISTSYKVRFAEIEDDGQELSDAREIRINAHLRWHPDLMCVVLLHEMAHADLPEYVGYKHDEGHGMRFQAKLDELYRLGAYDGLL